MPKKQWFYTWLLPLVWTPCSLINAYHFPGGEYIVWAMTSFAAWWIVLLDLRPEGLSQEALPIFMALGGALTIALYGWIMDLLRVSKNTAIRIWLVTAFFSLLFGAFVLGSQWCGHRPLGWLFFAINTGIHALIIIMIPTALIGKLIRLIKGGKKADPDTTSSQNTSPV